MESRLPARAMKIRPNGRHLQMGHPFGTGTSVFLKILCE
jgi:hypothetical protein